MLVVPTVICSAMSSSLLAVTRRRLPTLCLHTHTPTHIDQPLCSGLTAVQPIARLSTFAPLNALKSLFSRLPVDSAPAHSSTPPSKHPVPTATQVTDYNQACIVRQAQKKLGLVFFDRLIQHHANTQVPCEVSRHGGDYRVRYDPHSHSCGANAEFEHDVELPVAALLEHIQQLDQQTQSDDTHLRVYCAQRSLFHRLPMLNHFVPQQPPISMPTIERKTTAHINAEQFDRRVWLGPAGTVSPMHFDPHRNAFLQLVGSKRFYILPPDCSDVVSPYDDNAALRNTTTLSHDEIARLAAEHGLIVDVHAGDVLYLPQRWWHQVEALKGSFSVSYWF